MEFNTILNLKADGFEGFKSIKTLVDVYHEIPDVKGIYLIIKANKEPPLFLEVGSGGHFKGRNPNVSIDLLLQNWVDNTTVLYIGKAGGDIGSATLRSRLKQYFKFGQGRNIGHWGGRFIWQIGGSGELIVCWKPLTDKSPRVAERQLIAAFVAQFGKRPFANLTN